MDTDTDHNHLPSSQLNPSRRLKPSAVQIPYLHNAEHTTHLRELLGEIVHTFTPPTLTEGLL